MVRGTVGLGGTLFPLSGVGVLGSSGSVGFSGSTGGSPGPPGEIQKRIGEILGAGRKRPLTPEEEAELKHLGEVLGALRKAQSRKVNTADASHLLWYAFASALSFSLLSIYYFLRKLRKKR